LPDGWASAISSWAKRQIGEGQPPLTDQCALQQHAPRSRGRWPRRLIAPGKGIQQLGHVEATVTAQDDVQPRRVELDVGEGPRRPEQARELKVDEEAVEAQQGAPVALLKAEALDLQLEQERIDAHLADLQSPLELFLDVAGHVAGDQPGQQEETGQRVEDEQGRDHGGGDEERPSGHNRGEPSSPAASEVRHHAQIPVQPREASS
jgi:hypothetical protein